MSTSYDTPPGAPDEQHPYPPARPAGPRSPQQVRRWSWVVASVAVSVVMLGTMAVVGSRIGGETVVGVAAPAAPTSTVRTTTPPPPQLTVPNVQGMTGEEAVAALTAAGFRNIIFAQNSAPPSAKVLTQDPVSGRTQAGTAPIRLVAEPPPPVPHRAVSGRDWLLIAKSPDLHIGERITVYGHVTQFDTATGTSAFRASVDGVQHRRTYEYETNTILRGTAVQLANVVQGDVFRADVTVKGSYSYETTMGGTLSVPALDIDAITVVG
jgi:PASTA domain